MTNYEPYPPPAPPHYGQPISPGPMMPVAYAPMVALRPTSGISVAALVTGLVSVFGGFCLFAIPAVLAVVFGHMGLKDTRYETKGGRGMAITGLVLGYICLLPGLWVAFSFVLSLGMFASAASTAP